jgi:phosphoribosylamine--glycine ligase
MKVLVVGSGAREHAIASRIAQSAGVTQLLCAPGNGGTAAIAENVAVAAEDVLGIVKLAKDRGVGFVVVGPEGPLVAGLVDALEEAGIEAFGPKRVAAQLEGSKAFSKAFMERHAIPTAGSATFTDVDAAVAYARSRGKPLVVKADGLAAGKGVVVARTVDETVDAIERVMRAREFGAAGERVVLEEVLVGEEVSFHVLLDGEHSIPLAAAQDHKRLMDHDEGPNTGGMGAYSPPPVVTAEVEKKILERVVAPTVAGLRKDNIPFRGVLFIGLMIDNGEPYVLEYNTRFGDPETEVLLARFDGDLLALLRACAQGKLDTTSVRWKAPCAMAVVLAAGGYPGSYEKGRVISGLDEAAEIENVQVLHAGTRLERNPDGDTVTTAGGRVLAVTARGTDIDSTAARAYEAVSRIAFHGMQYRRDIGHHARRK